MSRKLLGLTITWGVRIYLYVVERNRHAVDAPHIRHQSGTAYLLEMWM